MVFTYNFLIEKIVDYSNSKEIIYRRVEEVANWQLVTRGENFILSMLINRQDQIAANVAEFYLDNIDDGLLKFAI